MKDRSDIEKRYEQFRCIELPGQPMMAHMGTNYLVNDLHTALVETETKYDRLREVVEKIAAMPLSASWRQHFYDAVKMAQDVLQEAGDELPRDKDE